MSIAIKRIDLNVLNMKARMPFRYGIASLVAVPHLFVRVTAEIHGRREVGLAADGEDTAAWRAERSMARQPAVAVVSASLDWTLPPSLSEHGQAVHVLTTPAAPRDRIAALRASGCEVVVTGAGSRVHGREVAAVLNERGYRRLYLQTGPGMLETALRDRVLSRLYATISHRVVGGERFDTMLRGGLLGAAGRLRLRSLYLDQSVETASGQFFASFEPT